MRTIEEILAELDGICPRIFAELEEHLKTRRISEDWGTDNRKVIPLPDAYAAKREGDLLEVEHDNGFRKAEQQMRPASSATLGLQSPEDG